MDKLMRSLNEYGIAGILRLFVYVFSIGFALITHGTTEDVPGWFLVIILFIIYGIVEFTYSQYMAFTIALYCKKHGIKYLSSFRPPLLIKAYFENINSLYGNLNDDISNYMEISYPHCKIICGDFKYVRQVLDTRRRSWNMEYKTKDEVTKCACCVMKLNDYNNGHSSYSDFDSVCTAAKPSCFSPKFIKLKHLLDHIDLRCEINDEYICLLTRFPIQGESRKNLMDFMFELGSALKKSQALEQKAIESAPGYY